MDYLIELELPDGYHWFGGLITKTMNNPKTGGTIDLPVNFWTPYKDEIIRFDDKEKAEELNSTLLKDCAAVVVAEKDANLKYAYFAIGKGVYLGARRIANVNVGDCFKFNISKKSKYFKCLKLIENNTKMICAEMYPKDKNAGNGKTEVFGRNSQRFVYVIYDTSEKKKTALN